MAITYNNLYLDIRQQLRRSGVEAATLEARELVCFGTNKSREELQRDGGLYASPELERQVRALVERRMAGEPVAYLIGEWEFYGLTLEVCRDVLIPRPDTETLVDRGILFVRDLPEGTRVLDLCAGSGCVGLAIAENCPNTQVVLAEWSEDAIRVCRQNIRRRELNGQVQAAQADAMAPPSHVLRDFDLILCNPPYIPTADLEGLEPSVRDYEPHMALDGGADGMDFYRAIARDWRCALKPGGMLAFEVGIHQAPAVERILAENGFTDIQTTRDPGGHQRVVEGDVGQMEVGDEEVV